MVMIGDEGQSDEGQAMESLGTGVTGGLLPSLLLCFFAGGAGLQEERGRELELFTFLLILLWIEMKL